MDTYLSTCLGRTGKLKKKYKYLILSVFSYSEFLMNIMQPADGENFEITSCMLDIKIKPPAKD